RVKNRDHIKVIALRIVRDNLEPEEVNKIAFDLAMSANSYIAGSSRLKLLRKELRTLDADKITIDATKIPFITQKANQDSAFSRIIRSLDGKDIPDFFSLDEIQERLKDC